MPKSIYSEPMPSPNGTNYERLFIVRKPFAEAMALDAAMSAGGPVDKFANYNANLQLPDGSGDDDPEDHPAAPDTEDQVRELLSGKLDPADLDALCNLIFGDDTDAPTSMPAQDKRRRMGRDQKLAMPSRQQMEKLVAQGAARRADRVLKQHADLMQRFPALKNARVVG